MGFLDKLFKRNKGQDSEAVKRHFQKGTQYGQSQDWHKAIAEFEAVLAIDSKHAGAHQMLALSYGAIMDRDAALGHYEVLRNLDPKKAHQLAAQPAFKMLLK